MTRSSGDALSARKQPRQARARVTVDAIFEATIQVLLSEGLSALTTTQVAARAGVSVGTLYQYFPQKQALLFALLQRRLEAVSDAVCATCARCRGMPVDLMVDALVHAYLDAKTGDIAATRALYVVAAELDTDALLGAIARRNHSAIRDLLLSAGDRSLDQPDAVAFTLRATLAGTTRAVLARDATQGDLAALRAELPVLCRAYLVARSDPL